jgi:hypothetical protein
MYKGPHYGITGFMMLSKHKKTGEIKPPNLINKTSIPFMMQGWHDHFDPVD